MKKKTKILISIAVMIFMICAVNVSFVKAESKVIKVGYIDYPGFIQKMDDGSYEGYGVEYLNEIAKYNNWTYEFVENTWEQTLKDLKNGKIDIICQAQKTAEREKDYIFSNYSVGSEFTIVYANLKSNIYYKDLEGMNNKKVGMLKDSYQMLTWTNYANKNKIKYTPVYYNSETEIVQALKDNKIDLAAVGSISLHKGMRVVDRFNQEPFYIVTGKMNGKFMAEVDRALDEIRNDSPYFQQHLQDKYYSESAYSNQPLLTKEENEYIERYKEIVVGLKADSIPYSYKEAHKITGLFKGVLDLMGGKSKLSIRIEYVSDPKKFLEEGTNRFYIGNSLGSGVSTVKGKYWHSNNIFSVDQVIVKRKNTSISQDKVSSVAVVKDALYNSQTKLLYVNSDEQIKKYDSVKECMEAVRTGKVDFAINDIYSVNYYMQSKRYADSLAAVSEYNESSAYCLLASAQVNDILKSVVNKLISSISDEEIDNVCVKYSSGIKYNASLTERIEDNLALIILGIAIAILLMVLGYVVISKKTNALIQSKENEILRRKVEIDKLTGLYNIDIFYEKVAERLRISDEEFYIMNININRLKVVNDIYGIEEGDELIKHVADRLKMFRDSQTDGDNILLARMSDDNFFALLTKEQYDLIKTFDLVDDYHLKINITVRTGLYLVDDRTLPINVMCDRAQIATDTVKEGMKKVGIYSRQQGDQLIFEQNILNDINGAMEQGQIVIYIQPKYDVVHKKIVGGESLVRWLHPKFGMIPPFKFITVLEKNNYITRLDYYVWEKTCQLLRYLKDKNGSVLPISVNVSRVNFYTTNLVSNLLELVEKYNLEPKDLQLEITETVYTEEKQVIYSIISELQEAGFKILMDDFGSGYSSLNMLKDAPIDVLKLDMAFMRNLDNENERNNIIVESIVELSKKLNISVVVEGVESEKQVNFLKSIGAEVIQGYYFSKPIPTDEYEKLIEE